MTYGCEVKRNLGKQFGNLRLQKMIKLHEVAKETNIPLKALDALESGTNLGWRYYRRLFRYYDCELKIICKE